MDRRVQQLIPTLAVGLGTGVVAGFIFGAALAKLGMISMIGSLVGVQHVAVGWFLNFVISAVVGAGYGLLFRDGVRSLGHGLASGVAYGILWWFLGALTGMSVLRGQGLDWSVTTVRSMFPSLAGHIIFGLVLGAILVLISSIARGDLGAGWDGRDWVVTFALGGSAGFIALVVYRLVLGGDATAALREAWGLGTGLFPLIGTVFVVAGIFGLVFEDELTGHGSSLAWGLMFGFVTWVLVPLTLLPLVHQGSLRWSIADVEATLAGLVGLLLFSVLTAVVFFTFVRLRHALFRDEIVRARADEGLGARSVRAVSWGVVASVAGGVSFSVVMVWMGLLPAVAGLIGAQSAVVGFIVHMVISAIIGGTYGLLFRREATTLGAGIAWGLVYALFWWFLGPLSLMPRILGEGITWTVVAAHRGFPSLIGHLAYGATTALVFQILANRYELESAASGARERRPHIVSEAAPLWASILALGLMLPLLVIP